MYNNKQIFSSVLLLFCFYLISCDKNNTQIRMSAINRVQKNPENIIQQEDVEFILLTNNEDQTKSGNISQQKDIVQIKEIELIPLAEDEGLKFERELSENDDDPDTFIIHTTKKRALLKFQEDSYDYSDEFIKYGLYENGLPKRLIVPYFRFPQHFYELELGFCFVDGKKGKSNFFATSVVDVFEIDGSASHLCIGTTKDKAPIVIIYNLETMEEIKKIVYEPYRNKGMYPVQIDYKDGAFIVMISADTDEFTTLKIFITSDNHYEVINSFSYDD